MRKLLYLIANGLAAYMDFGIGCFIALIVAALTSYPLSWWEPLVAGGVFCLLPDYDIAFQILWTGATGKKLRQKHHESIMHWPAFMIPLVGIATWPMGNYWCITALCCVAAHYVHDAAMMGSDGLKWLTRVDYLFWSKFGRKEPGGNNHERWIAENWMQPSTLSILELLFGTACISVEVILFVSGNAGLVAFILEWACIGLFWHLARRHAYAYA